MQDAAIDCVAGSLGAVALVYVGQPFDTVKVKMQTFPNRYEGMTHCFKETFKKEGIRGLYAGTVASIFANVAENAVLFGGYGACQKAIAWAVSKEAENLKIIENAAAGSMASFFSSFALCPTELVKCRAQAMREKSERSPGVAKVNMGPITLTQEIIRQEGTAGLFRGLSSTLAREVPGYFFFFGGYEGARELLAPPGVAKADIGPWRTMLSGAVGGTIFWLVMFPIDVVKSRIQVEGLRDSMFSVLSCVFQTEGYRALYKGLLPTLMRTMPACATLFLVYEYSRKIMHRIFTE